MSVFQIIALLLTLSALFSYLNYRFIKLPSPVGAVCSSLPSCCSFPLQFLGFTIPGRWPHGCSRVWILVKHCFREC